MGRVLPATIILVLLAVTPAGAARQAASSCDAPAMAAGTYIDLDVPIPGARWITLRAINDRGDIVGEFGDDTALHSQGFLLRGPDVTLIAVPGATMTRATGINAAGTVVGLYSDAVSAPLLHAFTWTRGRFTLYPASAGMRSLSFGGINASGAVAGSYGVDPVGEQAFVLRRGDRELFDAGDSPWAFAIGINDPGDVLLLLQRLPGPGRGRYVLATRRGLEPVAGCWGLDGFANVLSAVTNQRSFVGHIGLRDSSGVVYSDRSVTLYNYPGASSTTLVDMNSAGRAIGHASDGTTTRPFLFIPHGR